MSHLTAGAAQLPPAGAVFAARPPRTRTCLNGKIVYGDELFGDGVYSVDCAIRDISEGGAKLTLKERQFLPVDLFLIVIRNAVVHEAKIVWLKYPARGVRFLSTHSFADALPQRLQYLRRIWGNLYANAGWDTMN
jgi:hypothetical protein